MTLASKPYVCVSGIATEKEAKETVSAFRYYGFYMHSEVLPSVGIQSSYKSIEYGYSEGNRRVPHINRMPSILEELKDQVFSVMHYFTKNPDRLSVEVSKLLSTNNMYDNGLVNGMQLNGIWPSVTGSIEAQRIKASYPELKIILQLKPSASNGMSEGEALQRLVSAYSPSVDYVLLDASGGLAKELDITSASNAYDLLRSNGFDKGVGFAGGFNGENVYGKVNALKDFMRDDDFSIDAEGGLRDKLGDGYGNDALNMAKVKSYIEGAARVLLS